MAEVSAIWTDFGTPVPRKVGQYFCRLCITEGRTSTIYKTKNSTSSMIAHVYRHHKEELTNVNKLKQLIAVISLLSLIIVLGTCGWVLGWQSAKVDQVVAQPQQPQPKIHPGRNLAWRETSEIVRGWSGPLMEKFKGLSRERMLELKNSVNILEDISKEQKFSLHWTQTSEPKEDGKLDMYYCVLEVFQNRSSVEDDDQEPQNCPTALFTQIGYADNAEDAKKKAAKDLLHLLRMLVMSTKTDKDKPMDDDEEVDSTTSLESEESEEDFDLAEYQRKDRERREEEEQRKLNPVEPSATSSTFPTATLDSGESVETFDLEDYKRKDIEKHTARQREARKRAESRNAKELADKAKPAEDVSSDSDSSDEDESDTEDTFEGKKAPGKKPSARKAPAVPYERAESLFAKQMDLYKNDIPKELFSSQPKPPAPKRQQPQAVSTSSRSTQGTSDKENKSAEKQRETEANGQQLSEKGKKKDFEAVKSSASATRSSKQPNVVVEEDEESEKVEMVLLPPETKIQKAKVPFPVRVLAGRESMTSEISPSQNQGSFLTSTPSQKTVGLSQGQRQSIALSPLSSAKEPKMGHLILTQKTHQVSSRLPVGVQPLPLRIETEEDGVMSDPEANRKSASRQAKLRASQSHSEVQAVGKQRLGRSSRASDSQPVKNGTFDVPHGFGSAEPRIKRTPHGPRAATAEEKAAEEDNREEESVSEKEEDFPDKFPKTVSGSQNENERSFPPAAPTEEETEEVYTSKAQSSIVRTQDRNFTADLPLPAAEDAEGASISRKAPRKQQKNEETFPVVAGPSTSPATVELATEKAPLPPKHAPRPRASKKGKEASVIKLPTRKTKRDKGHPSTAAVFEEEEEEAPASKAQPSPVRPGERIRSQEFV